MQTMAHPVSVRLEEKTFENLDRLAKKTKRSRSFIIKEAVEAYLGDRVKYFEELEEAVTDAKSGYGHSSQQIHDWMKSWGSESELASPEPDVSPKA